MGDNHDDCAPRLSGMWVGLPEAFAWIATREAPVAASHAQSSLVRLSLGMAFYMPTNGLVANGIVNAARAALLAALKHGNVLARGRPGNQLEPLEGRAEIGPDRWAFLTFGEIGQKFRAQAEDGQTADFWHDVIVQADQLVKAFPPPVLFAKEDENGVVEIIAPVAQLEADGRNIVSDDTSTDAHCNTLARPGALQGVRPQTVALGPPRPTARQVIDAILNTWEQGGFQDASRPRKVATLKVASDRSGETRASCEEAWDISVGRFPGTAWKQGRPKHRKSPK